jgi:hypothetical protein
VYAEGTSVPIIGARVESTSAAQDALLRLPGAAPAHFDYIGTYMTLAEYYPPAELPADPKAMLQGVADLDGRLALLGSLAAINAISKRPGGFATIADTYRAGMADQLRERFDAAMRVPTGGLGRLVVGPQPVLLAMRRLLDRPPVSEPAGPEADPRITYNRAILFSHALAATLRDPVEEKVELSIEDRKRLMLAMMTSVPWATGTTSMPRSTEPFASGGTTAAWRPTTSLPRRTRGRPVRPRRRRGSRGRAGDRLLPARPHHGLGTGQTTAPQPGHPPSGSAQMRGGVLDLIAQDFERSQRELGDPISEYDLLALEANPVLIEPNGLVVLDQDLLWNRCTSGLYWVVHDGLKASDGEGARHQWTMAYAAMVEALAEDSLRPLAPPLLSGAAMTFFTEEDFEHAYGAIARSDVGIDFGEAILLVEIVSGQLTVVSRVQGNLAKLEQDFDRLVIDKCVQLDSIASRLLEDEEPLTALPKGVRYPRIVPVVVVGGSPLNSLSYSYIRVRLEELELFQHPLISPLSVIDLEDVEMLKGIGERGYSPAQVLEDWQASELRDYPIHNFLIRQGLLAGGARPARMVAAFDAAFRDVVQRLRIEPPPESS